MTQLFAVLMLLFSISAHAVTTPAVTMQGRITKTDGSSFSGNVQFRVQILSPVEQCVLFDETQTKDLTGAEGLFSISLNDGSTGNVRNDANSWSFQQALSNKYSFSVSSSYCQSGTGVIHYTPAAADERKVLVQFKDSTMTAWDSLPVATLTHSASAIDSIQVGGFAAANLCRVEDAGVPASVSSLTSANYTELLALVNGTSTVYAKSGAPTSAVDFGSQRLTNVATPTAATDASTKGYVDSNFASTAYANAYIGGKAVDSTVTSVAAGDAGKVLQWDGTQWIAATPAISSQWVTNSTMIGYTGGNVGIGTTSPVTKLQVNGSVLIGNGNETCASGFAGAIRYNISTTSVEMCNGTGWLALSAGSGAGTTNASTITNASGGIAINPQAGFGVSIGSTQASTSAGTGALVVNGGVGVSGNVNASGDVNATGNMSATAITASGALSAASVISTGAVTAGSLTTTGALSAGSVTVGGTALNVASANAWTVNGSDVYRSGGKVGIGVSSPSATLDVSGGTFTVRNIAVQGVTGINSGNADFSLKNAQANGYFDFAVGTTGILGIYDALNNRTPVSVESGASANSLYVKSTGNVGFGTTSPAYPVDSASDINAAAWFRSGQNAVLRSTSGITQLFGNTGKAVQITTNGSATPSMYFDTAGNVGVGTTSPTAPLHVIGNGIFGVTGVATRLQITPLDTTSPSAIAEYYRAETNPRWAAGRDAVGSGISGFAMRTGTTDATLATVGVGFGAAAGTGQLGLYTTNGTALTERMHIDSSGKVGIGTSSPAYTLDVVGSINANQSVSATGVSLAQSPASNYASPGSSSSPVGAIIGAFNSASSDTSFVGTSYRVKNGTAVNQYLYEGAVAQTGAGTAPAYVIGQSTAAAVYTERLRIDSSGNVGIGTTSPTQALEVNGNVKATSFISTSDRRLKDNITPVPGLDLVTKLSGVRWNWKRDGSPDAGVIAQEVEEVYPLAVVTDQQTGFKAVKYNTLIAPLIESTKELYGLCKDSQANHAREIASLKEQNAALAKTVDQLKDDNAKMKRDLDAIKAKLGLQ